MALSAVARPATPRSFSDADWAFYALDGTLENGVPTLTGGDFNALGIGTRIVLLVTRVGTLEFPDRNLGVKVVVLNKEALLRGEPVSSLHDFVGLTQPSDNPPWPHSLTADMRDR